MDFKKFIFVKKIMLTSLAFIFLLGLLLGWIFNRMKMPALLGMLLTGIMLGPYVLNLLAPQILNISPDLRQLALVIILMRAGLALNFDELRKAGRAAILMCFVPALFEIAGIVILAPRLLGVNYIEAALMGTVVAAVSPAVIVPKMLSLLEQKYGSRKSIPQMIMAAGSVDDVFVIVLFTLFTGLVQGEQISANVLLEIPVSIISGLLLGAVMGWLLQFYFKHFHLRDSVKVLILLSVSFLMIALEHLLKGKIALSGLLAIMTMGAAMFHFYPVLAKRLSSKFQKLWIAAELILFVLVGATVDISYVKAAGLSALFVILGAWVFRMAGVAAALIRTPLNGKEKLFCMIAYSPKATVQAAIGSIPLALGLPCGKVILTVAVLAILITAPLGAFGIDATYKKLLSND
ncbi:MAG: cation:proton antiporter [Bacteroidales bacterium]